MFKASKQHVSLWPNFNGRREYLAPAYPIEFANGAATGGLTPFHHAPPVGHSSTAAAAAAAAAATSTTTTTAAAAAAAGAADARLRIRLVG